MWILFKYDQKQYFFVKKISKSLCDINSTIYWGFFPRTAVWIGSQGTWFIGK
jgi:hypothetical protein